jgi:DMSO/TMAO reductase YedYZ molybdopterin-dependent catalytic subunit
MKRIAQRTRPSLRDSTGGHTLDRSVDRRNFLLTGGAALSAAWIAACNSPGPRAAQPLLEDAEHLNERVERALFRHTSMDVAGRNAKDAGRAFPIYYISDNPPAWNQATGGPWSLEVGGMVARPMQLSLDDLQRLPRITQRVNHYCVEGWQAVSSWTGVRLSELAAIAKPAPEARYVDFQSFDDGYHESWDIESAMHPQTLIAYGMEGMLLGMAHGGPARVHSPVKLGYKNTKYLTKIIFMPMRNGGYWSDQGYEWYGGT